MGALVGVAYAVGYSAMKIEEIIKTTDWETFYSDTPPRDLLPYLEKKSTGRYQLEFGLKGLKPQTRGGLISWQKASLFLSKLTSAYNQITDFDQLPIPFRCVAVDLITGREVARLVGGYMEPGYDQVQWNARELPSGIYIARLVTPEFTKSIKMVLLK